jgi:chemotaxis-related protein WspB
LNVLFLLFHLGDDCYALDASKVAEILPLVRLKTVSRSAPGVVGAFDYHGTFVPVVDLSVLVLDRPAAALLSTRLILVRCAGDDAPPRYLGLIAERATETIRCEPADFVSSGITRDDAPYLGPVAKGPHGFIQRIELDRLLLAFLPHLSLKQDAEAL